MDLVNKALLNERSRSASQINFGAPSVAFENISSNYCLPIK